MNNSRRGAAGAAKTSGAASAPRRLSAWFFCPRTAAATAGLAQLSSDDGQWQGRAGLNRSPARLSIYFNFQRPTYRSGLRSSRSGHPSASIPALWRCIGSFRQCPTIASEKIEAAARRISARLASVAVVSQP